MAIGVTAPTGVFFSFGDDLGGITFSFTPPTGSGVAGPFDQNDIVAFTYENTTNEAFTVSINIDINAGHTLATSSGNSLTDSKNAGKFKDEVVYFYRYEDFDPSTVPAAVPLPAALPLYGSALGIMGFVGWRKRRKLAAMASAQA